MRAVGTFGLAKKDMSGENKKKRCKKKEGLVGRTEEEEEEGGPKRRVEERMMGTIQQRGAFYTHNFPLKVNSRFTMYTSTVEFLLIFEEVNLVIFTAWQKVE